jgi:hypothetical protein
MGLCYDEVREKNKWEKIMRTFNEVRCFVTDFSLLIYFLL